MTFPANCLGLTSPQVACGRIVDKSGACRAGKAAGIAARILGLETVPEPVSSGNQQLSKVARPHLCRGNRQVVRETEESRAAPGSREGEELVLDDRPAH